MVVACPKARTVSASASMARLNDRLPASRVTAAQYQSQTFSRCIRRRPKRNFPGWSIPRFVSSCSRWRAMTRLRVLPEPEGKITVARRARRIRLWQSQKQWMNVTRNG